MTAAETSRHELDAKAIAICTYLGQRGHTVDFFSHKNEVVVKPTPPMNVIERIIANESILVAYFRSLNARPATNHAFRPWTNLTPEAAQTLGVCMVCGVPWAGHGEPPESAWQPVSDLKPIAERRCAPVWKIDEVAA